MAEPEAVTTNAQLVTTEYNKLSYDNCVISVIPVLSTDGFTLNLKATVIKPETLTAQANVWDGQTLAIIPAKSNGTNRLAVFITMKLVDSIGNQIHSNEELFSREQKMKSAIPPQQ